MVKQCKLTQKIMLEKALPLCMRDFTRENLNKEQKKSSSKLIKLLR